MSATKIYPLPTGDEPAWCDDLVTLGRLKGEDIEEALRRPFRR